jgi:hypothetical protein
MRKMEEEERIERKVDEEGRGRGDLRRRSE